MRKYYSALIIVPLFSCMLHAQFISSGMYVPADKKVHWTSFNAEGNWSVYRDTLFLNEVYYAGNKL